MDLHALMNLPAAAVMKRFRLSTLMLLIVIAALTIALAIQHRRATRAEAELQAELATRPKLYFDRTAKYYNNAIKRLTANASVDVKPQ
jgi:hypothetical protein